VREVPGSEPALLAFDHEQAFAGEDEQVLQTGLGPLHAGVRDPAWSIRRDSRSEGAASAQRTA